MAPKSQNVSLKRTAVLLDGGFVTWKLRERLKRFPTADEVREFALVCLDHSKGEELFRIYFYDCEPFNGKKINPITRDTIDFTATPSYKFRKRFYEELACKDNIAFRKGELKWAGWKISDKAIEEMIKRTKTTPGSNDIFPDFIQKQVDMKIGLDVAWLSSKRIVDTIILVSGDADMIPAMKFARREGVRIVMVTLRNYSSKKDLQIHADEFRDVEWPPKKLSKPKRGKSTKKSHPA